MSESSEAMDGESWIPIEERIIGKNYNEMDIACYHEQARLVMADLEDILYSAVVRAIGDTFGGD